MSAAKHSELEPNGIGIKWKLRGPYGCSLSLAKLCLEES